MAVFRSFAPVLLCAALLAGTGTYALADPPQWSHGHGHGPGDKQDDPHQNAGPRPHAVVSGTVIGVDYGSASILVGTPHGPVPVAVTPTTSIIHGATYASLADLGRGARVSIDVIDVGGRLIAQIIRIH
ncbi:MAG TPA: hypothetical protein VGZ02_07135 [Candidatus Baltobacteraceae bacterium]|jgi:hypothetical protein|nr:hypothetical protein [Candidatus Baltobacteraceae bacterium]